MPNNRIVVGVDGSPGARSALLWAADEARLRAARLLVVHAPDPADVAMVASAGEPGIRATDGVGDLLLHAQAALASARQPSVAVAMLLSHARAADALIDQSHDADLVVVGTRGHGGITMSLLGSVSHRVAAHAHCPVAIVPERPAIPTVDSTGGPRIVVGLSSSPAGRSALEFAVGEATYRRAVVQAVRAWAEPDTALLLDTGLARTAVHRLRQQAASHLEAELAGLQPGTGVPVETTLVDAEPADALIRASRRAQLLVVGCHHSDDRWSTRLGPVPAAIVHRTACPVVVVGTSVPAAAHRSAIPAAVQGA